MSARRRLFAAWDAVLLAALVFLCGALFWAAGGRGRGAVAVVEQNGVELCRVALADGAGKTTFAVPGEPCVVIAAENGEAWFESSGCPDQICVRSGRLSKTGETAACLPAGVVLRIEGKAAEDAVTG